MKEIEFLPEWYKSGKRRQISYRKQYIVLGSVLMVMVVWNFVTARSISKAQAKLVNMETRQTEAENLSTQLNQLKNKFQEVEEKAKIVENIDSRIDVASVLSEMSFLIDEEIVLSKVEFIAEKLQNTQDQQLPGGGAVVRAVRTTLNDKDKMPLGDVKFKVVINGVAVDAGDVAALILKLEESQYFCQVVLSYSKNAEITVKNNLSTRSKADSKSFNNEGNKKIQVSEFEISSYLANYIEQ